MSYIRLIYILCSRATDIILSTFSLHLARKHHEKKLFCLICFCVCVLKVIYGGENDQLFDAENLAAR